VSMLPGTSSEAVAAFASALKKILKPPLG